MSDTPQTTTGSNWANRSGIAATAKYNPHLWSADELRAIFVARQRELETILQVLRTTAPASAPQHLLITGQRGMGKSTLLQRVALAVEDDPGLQSEWLPLRFPEEQYTVSTPAELWTNVIGALADVQERLGKATSEIDAELAQLAHLSAGEREAASLNWIRQWCENHKKRLLLLMDSTDLLFANLAGGDANKRSAKKDGGASALWRVRRALLHAPHFFWLGGSYQPLEANGLYSDAFLDFFQLVELRPLTLVEMQTAIQAMARVFGAGRGLQGDDAEDEVKRLLDARPERLRAMRQLTGGNPRTTVMLYELFAAGGRDSIRADLERLLDAMTPLYKARLEVLADQPRKVFAHVMEHWAPISAKALAQVAHLTVGTVSTQLTRLEQEGLVEKTALGGTKRSGFQASERFFNIWYLMRNAPRGARSRVGSLVAFMQLWYSKDELQDLARVRWEEHRGGMHCDGPELEYSRAIARAMPRDAQNRRQLDWVVFQQARRGAAFNDLFDLQGEDVDYSTPESYLQRLETLRGALNLTPIAADERSAWVHEVVRALHLTLPEKEELAKECEAASMAKIADIRSRLSERRDSLIFNYGLESVEQVEAAVANDRFFPDCPDSALALTQMLECFEAHPAAFVVALGRLANRRSDAPVETACRKAMEFAPESSRPWNCLGDLLSKLDRNEEAEAAFRKAIELDPKPARPWGYLGDLLNKLDRNEEAEAAYRKAIELDPKSARPWGYLGDLLSKLDRNEEAEAAYRKAIELDPKWADAWRVLGFLLGKLDRIEAAEAAFRKAIDLDPKRATSWDYLGDLLGQLDRDDEAEAAYRKAIDLDPKWVVPWHDLGHLFDRLGRNEEAEAAYRKAIDLDPKWAASWDYLGDLLGQLDRNEEAEAAYRKAIDLDPKWVVPWHDLGHLFGRLNRNEGAEAAYRKAIDLDPKRATSWDYLGHLFGRLNRNEEAEAAYRKAIDLDPKWATSWSYLGDLFGRLNRNEEAEAAYRQAIDLGPKWAGPWRDLGHLFGRLNRNEEAEAAYRKAIDLSPKWAAPLTALGNLLQDRFKRYDPAEEAYRKAIECDRTNPFPVANLARLLALAKRNDEASKLYRQSLELADTRDNNLRLQAHCWLGNADLAMQALDALAELASENSGSAFYKLREQCFECHAIGLTKTLVNLMERSRFTDFLQPFALALRAASGEKDALLDVAVEVRGMAEEVLQQING
jgi:Flp pilus assembly protein TadD